MCQFGREDVIRHVTEKYGYVAQINTLAVESSSGHQRCSHESTGSPNEGQRIANFVPDQLNITLQDALDSDRDFLAEYERSTEVRDVVDMAKNLEHFARNVGVHAAGLVIAPDRWMTSFHFAGT